MKWESCCAARSANSLPIESYVPVIPLSSWADRQLTALALTCDSREIAALNGTTLLGQRAAIHAFKIPGTTSAGAGCRLYQAQDGWVAINMSRPDDIEMLPALFGDKAANFDDLEQRIAESSAISLVMQGRSLGLAIACTVEKTLGTAYTYAIQTPTTPPRHKRPLVVDLSALWAGPLTSHLMRLAGADVIKVESLHRPDMMRHGDPRFFSSLNDGKKHVLIDFKSTAGIAELRSLLAKADIVIEASRPRALLQMGIDANEIVSENPGKLWLTTSGHGAEGDAANWIGFGDDVAVAAGMVDAMIGAGGEPGFVGDAIGDPLSGILAARIGMERWRTGAGGRIIFSMRDVVAEAIREERHNDPMRFDAVLSQWSAARGRPFPC
jgi:hypothetical protein